MNKITTVLFLLLAFFSCQTNTAQEKGGTIEATDFKNKIEAGGDIQIIDVRTPEEFAGGHLEGAILMNFNSSDFQKAIGTLDKNKPTYIYCLSGGRSGSAYNTMLDKGFKEVYNMKGGILSWKKNNFPLAGSSASNETGGMTKAQFDSICNGPKPVLFDFMAKWCGPCKALKPILNELENEYGNQFMVVPIDIDVHKELAKELKISNIPFIMFYKSGKLQVNIEGLTTKENLISSLELKK